MDMSNEALDQILKDTEEKAKAELNTNPGHNALLADIEALLAEAQVCEFHDFLNTKYAAPKVELERRARQITVNTMEGKYDN